VPEPMLGWVPRCKLLAAAARHLSESMDTCPRVFLYLTRWAFVHATLSDVAPYGLPLLAARRPGTKGWMDVSATLYTYSRCGGRPLFQ
jgi:hypothetical protein